MEDFVPYKLAKKLNEKGFTLPKSNIIGKFDSDGVFHSQLYINFTETMDSEEIIAPTISQVLKWLREEKRIEVNACWDNIDAQWIGYATEMDKPDLVGYYTSPNNNDTYEKAALAGIEYVLDNNLI